MFLISPSLNLASLPAGPAGAVGGLNSESRVKLKPSSEPRGPDSDVAAASTEYYKGAMLSRSAAGA